MKLRNIYSRLDFYATIAYAAMVGIFLLVLFLALLRDVLLGMSTVTLAMSSYLCAGIGSILLASDILPKRSIQWFNRFASRWKNIATVSLDKAKNLLNSLLRADHWLGKRPITRTEYKMIFWISILVPVMALIFFHQAIPLPFALQVVVVAMLFVMFPIAVRCMRKLEAQKSFWGRTIFWIIAIFSVPLFYPFVFAYAFAAGMIEAVIKGLIIFPAVIVLYPVYWSLKGQCVLADLSVKTTPKHFLGYVGILFIALGGVFLCMSL